MKLPFINKGIFETHKSPVGKKEILMCVYIYFSHACIIVYNSLDISIFFYSIKIWARHLDTSRFGHVSKIQRVQ